MVTRSQSGCPRRRCPSRTGRRGYYGEMRLSVETSAVAHVYYAAERADVDYGGVAACRLTTLAPTRAGSLLDTVAETEVCTGYCAPPHVPLQRLAGGVASV